jgi:hypothetical protein
VNSIYGQGIRVAEDVDNRSYDKYDTDTTPYTIRNLNNCLKLLHIGKNSTFVIANKGHFLKHD